MQTASERGAKMLFPRGGEVNDRMRGRRDVNNKRAFRGEIKMAGGSK